MSACVDSYEANAASISTPATAAADTTDAAAVIGSFARVWRILLMCSFHGGAIAVFLQDLEHWQH
jgi:hypothetical protein